MKLFKIAMVLCLVSMIFIGCGDTSQTQSGTGNTQNNTQNNRPAEEPNDNPVQEPVTYPIYPRLSSGTSVEIPDWKKQDTGLGIEIPAVITNLKESETTGITNVTQELKDAMAKALATEGYFKPPKNVILMFSDGMGVRQVQASENYCGELIMTQLPYKAQAETHTYEMGDIITDSAAGGTALATGYKTTRLFVDVNAYGQNLKSLNEYAKEKGMKVGVISNAKMADATPATFTIHNKNRSNAWTKMCRQQMHYPVDLFFGNGGGDYSSYWPDADFKTTIEAENMKKYTNFSKLLAAFGTEKTGIKTYALFDKDRFASITSTSTTTPNLQEMTKYTLSWLQKEAGDDGFFCMIENTYTDHYGHGNTDGLKKGETNIVGIVNEVQSTDECVAICLKFVLENPDTVLIVTADHDTGNMQLFKGWETDMSLAIANTGDHSLQNVPVFAIGYGMEEAVGTDYSVVRSNAYTGQVLAKALGAENFGDTDGDNKYAENVIPGKFAAADADSSASSYKTVLTLSKDPIVSTNVVTFKIKPESYNHIKVTDANGKVYVDGAIEARSSATYEWVDDGKAKCAGPKIASAYDCAKWWTSASSVPATLDATYKVGDVTYSLMDGWYQIGFVAEAKSKTLTIELSGGNDSSNGAIDIDDLTVHFASTIGEILVNDVAAKYKF